ncbi:hypothetical protein FHX03_003124 [Rhizobium sp. BK456]|nr:hypothetical protein [Rhizobium sp. BK456]
MFDIEHMEIMPRDLIILPARRAKQAEVARPSHQNDIEGGIGKGHFEKLRHETHLPTDRKPPRLRLDDADQRIDEGRLADAIGAEHGQYPPPLQAEAVILQDGFAAALDGEIACLNHRTSLPSHAGGAGSPQKPEHRSAR